jgi:hypothetical protein
MDFRNYETDPAKEERGVWVGVGKGGELLIARIGNRGYLDALSRLRAEAATRFANDSIPEEEHRRILRRAVAEGVLLGWKGMTDGGQPVEYSVDEAEKRLVYRDFFDKVWELASDQERYRRDYVEQAGNGSPAMSAGV